MGMMARSFAMRLAHLNLQAYNLGDSNVPRIQKNDLLLVCSGSGETRTILELVKIARENQAQVGLVTAMLQSSMSSYADLLVQIPAPSKVAKENNSIQPMTTLNEQCLLIFLDTLVLLLMQKLDQTGEHMKTRHSILE